MISQQNGPDPSIHAVVRRDETGACHISLEVLQRDGREKFVAKLRAPNSTEARKVITDTVEQQGLDARQCVIRWDLSN